MRDATGDEATTTAIAAELRVTPQRVLKIQATALRKCRDWCKSHGYQLSDLLDTADTKTAQVTANPLAFCL